MSHDPHWWDSATFRWLFLAAWIVGLTIALQRTFGQSPEAELQEALRSIEALPEAERSNTRYLSLATVPKADRPLAAGVASFVLNSLSDSGSIARPEWATTELLRFNLRSYSNTEEHYKQLWEGWEELAAKDTTFHVQTLVAEPLAPIVEVKPKRGEKREPVAVAEPVIRQVVIDAPWLSKETCESIRTQAASIGPVLRLEPWLVAVMSPTSYYKMAGVPETRAEFLTSLGLDIDTVGRLDADRGANVVSRVALGRMRRVASYIAPSGHVWETRDVTTIGGERDALRQPLTRAVNPTTGQAATLFKFDASEMIATLPNGLHIFALFDGDGKRQDAVPLGGPGKSIAKDFSESHPNFEGVISPGLSCVRCHTESGLRPLEDVQATLVGVAALDDAKELQSFYNPPQVQLRLKQAREQYDVAVALATDLNAQQVAEGLSKLVRDYQYDFVTPERAALEMGISVEEFRELATLIPDPYVQAMMQGHLIHREAWATSFAGAMQAWIGKAEVAATTE